VLYLTASAISNHCHWWFPHKEIVNVSLWLLSTLHIGEIHTLLSLAVGGGEWSIPLCSPRRYHGTASVYPVEKKKSYVCLESNPGLHASERRYADWAIQAHDAILRDSIAYMTISWCDVHCLPSRNWFCREPRHLYCTHTVVLGTVITKYKRNLSWFTVRTSDVWRSLPRLSCSYASEIYEWCDMTDFLTGRFS
jgi:hypothetical protein